MKTFAIVLLIAAIFVTGCDEGMQMMKPAMPTEDPIESEKPEDPPIETTVGDMKDPIEPEPPTPLAMLADAPTGIDNSQILKVAVGGTDITHYKYSLNAGDECGTYGSQKPSRHPITEDLSDFPNGIITLCVLGKNSAGIWQTKPTVVQWTRDIPVTPEPQEPIIEDEVIIDQSLQNFIGFIYVPELLEAGAIRSETESVASATVTIMTGPRTGENVVTNQDGQYVFPHIEGDELQLLVEKEGFEPKEVIVHRSRPTTLLNGNMPNFYGEPQKTPGNILIGHVWPDEVRFILEETLIVYDLLYVEGGTSAIGDGGFYSSGGVVVIYSELVGHFHGKAGVLGTFAHELAHAHQQALVSVDGSRDIWGWKDTPEGRAFIEAREKDWEQVGKAPYDNIQGYDTLIENAAETCAHYWSVDRWGGRTAYGKLAVEAPNRFRWAEEWLKKK